MEKRTFRNNWFEFTPSFSGFSLRYYVASYFNNKPVINICLGFGNLFIYLPFKSSYYECSPPCYGIYYFEKAFWFCCGKKVKSWHLPWSYVWVKTSILLKNNKWEHKTKKNKKDFYEEIWEEKKWTKTFLYRYILKNGKTQNRLAKITIEKNEWRWKWFKWLAFIKKTSKHISVEFLAIPKKSILIEKSGNKKIEINAIGENVGSWKGGTTGCSYKMLKNEKPESTLRRMEIKRKL